MDTTKNQSNQSVLSSNSQITNSTNQEGNIMINKLANIVAEDKNRAQNAARDAQMNTDCGDVLFKDIDKNLVAIKIMQRVYKLGLTMPEAQALGVAAASSLTQLGDYQGFLCALEDNLESITVRVHCPKTGWNSDLEATMDYDKAVETLEKADILTDGDFGVKMNRLLTEVDRSYRPIPASIGVRNQTRRYPLRKEAGYELLNESIRFQERTKFCKDVGMVELAKAVVEMHKKSDSGYIDDEAYVLDGCDEMEEDVAYVSEFKNDLRARTYQACFRGPNGQSSDRSRSVMNYHGVTMKYDRVGVEAIIHA